MKSSKHPSPPRFAVWLAKRLERYQTNHAILDDMQEVFSREYHEHGFLSACIWYWRQCLDAVIKDIIFNLRWRFVMLINYLKIAFRTMRRHKGFSFINIFGLAVGLSCSFLIFTYVFDEYRYDRFHQDANRIYRIVFDYKSKDLEERGLLTSFILAKTLRENYPEKFLVTQTKLRGSIVNIDSKAFGNERIIGADDSFFDMFTYEFIAGDPKTALDAPNEAVITDEVALKYFGHSEAIGQTIQIDGDAFQITGVISNNHHNSHFYFDVVFSLKSLSNYGDPRYLFGYYSTYVKLPPSVPLSRLNAILAEYVEKDLGPLIANSGVSFSFGCESLLDIHLRSDLNGPYGANSKIEYIYLFSVIAFLILLIACFNYVNLTTAKNLNRAKEVGIRKAIGSMRSQINRQFLLESIVICWIAVGIAILFLSLSIPFFNTLIGKSLQWNILINPLTITGSVIFATVMGLIAGLYPALYLSSFETTKVLKDSNPQGLKKFRLQSALVVFQYTVSVFFMIGTLVINQQLKLVQKKNLGFDKEQILVLRHGTALGNQKEVFKSNLLKHPSILNVSGSSSLPGKDFNSWSITPEDVDTSKLDIYFCDHNFAETMGIEIHEGRFFSKEFPSDERSIVINEKAVEQFEWTDSPIGKKIRLNVHGDYTVIGVTKNFHYESLHSHLSQMGMILTEGKYNGMEKYLAIKYAVQNTSEVIATVKNEWNAVIASAPFDYSFLDEDYTRLYISEQQTQKIALLFAILAILISALGMLGLVSFSVENRKKEIGLRKILGASIMSVEFLIGKEFIKWVLLAILIACPIAYFVMNIWLNDFAYRASFSSALFIIPGVTAFGIALTVVSIKVVRTALANPVDSLRYE